LFLSRIRSKSPQKQTELKITVKTKIKKPSQLGYETASICMCFYVYILYSSSTDSFYKGQTRDIVDRLRRHNHGYEKATKNGIPWSLLWCTKKLTRSESVILEKKLKNFSKKRIKEFILRHPEGVAGPDDTGLKAGMSGC
jgi:putative endonuclease